MSRQEIRISGSGGQGLLLSARILAEALLGEGKSVAQSESYEPTSRGGLSRADLVISDGGADYPLVTSLDYLLILDQVAVTASDGLIAKDATVLVDDKRVTAPPKGKFSVVPMPLTGTAIRLGSERIANIVALGALNQSADLCAPETLEAAVRAFVPKNFLDLNLDALAEGYRLAGRATAAAPAAE